MNFKEYALCYNLFYAEKLYDREAGFIDSIIKKHHQGAQSILDLGCGTGRHAHEFFQLGYTVYGADRSEEMITIAKEEYGQHISFLQNDIRKIRLTEQFDVVLSLFDVMSYQTTNDDVRAVFETAACHLYPGGLFIFDCWHAPAVLQDKPKQSTKQYSNDNLMVTKTVNPVIDLEHNIVQIHYNITIEKKPGNELHLFEEDHEMRYFFVEEMLAFSKEQNFEPVQQCSWFTENLTKESWKSLFVFRKTVSNPQLSF